MQARDRSRLASGLALKSLLATEDGAPAVLSYQRGAFGRDDDQLVVDIDDAALFDVEDASTKHITDV